LIIIAIKYYIKKAQSIWHNNRDTFEIPVGGWGISIKGDMVFLSSGTMYFRTTYSIAKCLVR